MVERISPMRCALLMRGRLPAKNLSRLIQPAQLLQHIPSNEQLFKEATNLYVATVGGPTLRALEEGQTARERLSAMLRLTAEVLSQPGKPHGCMLSSEP